MLKNHCLIAKIGVDTAENEPLRKSDLHERKEVRACREALSAAPDAAQGTAEVQGGFAAI